MQVAQLLSRFYPRPEGRGFTLVLDKIKLKTVDGKSPHDLLLSSLDEINKTFEELRLSYEESNLHKLSTTNKYLKSI